MKTTCVLLLLALTALAVPILAVREEPVPDPKHAAEMAANEAASPFIALIKMLLGSGDASMNADASTVAELAANAPGNMSILVDGVERAGLHTAIADPNFEATIFAPTNWAFEVALVKLKITPAQLWTDKTALTNLLSYHTIQGKALSAADLHDGMKLKTVSQHELTVKVDKVAGTIIQGAGGDAKVLAADICAGKTIIHVIDTVLVPPKPTTES
jgi:uncharacterized surface protein with fasciclin (FAS1) repeats